MREPFSPHPTLVLPGARAKGRLLYALGDQSYRQRTADSGAVTERQKLPERE